MELAVVMWHVALQMADDRMCNEIPFLLFLTEFNFISVLTDFKKYIESLNNCLEKQIQAKKLKCR